MRGELKPHPSVESVWSSSSPERERVRPAGLQGSGGPPRDVQQLWLALARQPWRTLVLVPARPGGEARALAEALREAGELSGEGPIDLVEAGDADLAQAREILARLGAPGRRAIVAVEAVQRSPGSRMLALAADAVVLCVELGETAREEAEQAIELIGRERIVGAAAVEAAGAPERA